MNKKQLLVATILFIIGLMGIASLLTMEVVLPKEAAILLKAQFSELQIRLLVLVNPIILLTVSVLIGAAFFQKVNLKVLFFSKWLEKKNIPAGINFLKQGLLGGIIAGVLLGLHGVYANHYLQEEMAQLSTKIQPNLLVKILYGGITEEIMMRFGLMTFFVWIAYKITKVKSKGIYWTGILLAAVLFALGHLPIVFQSIPNPSSSLLIYILSGNFIGGLIFGYVYWKQGLESAMIAHVIAHLVMLFA